MTFKEWLNYPPYGLKIAKKIVIVFWILFLVMVISSFMQLKGLASLLSKLIYFPLLSYFYSPLSVFDIYANIFFKFIFLSLFYFIFPILIFKTFEFFKGNKNLPYWAKFGINAVFVYWGCLFLYFIFGQDSMTYLFILIILNPYLFIFPESLASNYSLLIIILVIGGTLFYFLLGAIIGKIVEFLSKIYLPLFITFYPEIKKHFIHFKKIIIVLLVSIIIIVGGFFLVTHLRDYGGVRQDNFNISLEEGAPKINITILNISQPIHPDRTYCEKNEDCVIGCCGGCENKMAKPTGVVIDCMCAEDYIPAIGCECVNNACKGVHTKL